MTRALLLSFSPHGKAAQTFRLARALLREQAPEAEVVERERWESLLRAQGAQHPMPRMRMVDGFNEGWICFEHDAVLKGTTSLDRVLRSLAS